MAVTSVPLGRDEGTSSTMGRATYVVAQPKPIMPRAVVVVPTTALKYAGPACGQKLSASIHVEKP